MNYTTKGIFLHEYAKLLKEICKRLECEYVLFPNTYMRKSKKIKQNKKTKEFGFNTICLMHLKPVRSIRWLTMYIQYKNLIRFFISKPLIRNWNWCFVGCSLLLASVFFIQITLLKLIDFDRLLLQIIDLFDCREKNMVYYALIQILLFRKMIHILLFSVVAKKE